MIFQHRFSCALLYGVLTNPIHKSFFLMDLPHSTAKFERCDYRSSHRMLLSANTHLWLIDWSIPSYQAYPNILLCHWCNRFTWLPNFAKKYQIYIWQSGFCRVYSAMMTRWLYCAIVFPLLTTIQEISCIVEFHEFSVSWSSDFNCNLFAFILIVTVN